jgi:DNA-binding response OmpR family regulator
MAKPRILIVEDDASVREALAIFLEGEGYTVVEAGDGAGRSRVCAAASPSASSCSI